VELSAEQFKQLVDEAASLARVTEELNAELFKQQVAGGSGGGGGVNARQTEKRSATRIGVRYLVTVRPAGNSATPFRATMFDLSKSGVGLVCPFAMQGQFTLEMPNCDGIIFAVTCTARSSRPLGPKAVGYAVGATFDDVFAGAMPAPATAASEPTTWDPTRSKVA
jgi:hypothetical protein